MIWTLCRQKKHAYNQIKWRWYGTKCKPPINIGFSNILDEHVQFLLRPTTHAIWHLASFSWFSSVPLVIFLGFTKTRNLYMWSRKITYFTVSTLSKTKKKYILLQWCNFFSGLMVVQFFTTHQPSKPLAYLPIGWLIFLHGIHRLISQIINFGCHGIWIGINLFFYKRKSKF